MAHDFSGKYGHDNYLKVSNFDTGVKRWEHKTSAQKIGDVSDLISKLQHEVARQLDKNNPMISHYMLEYAGLKIMAAPQWGQRKGLLRCALVFLFFKMVISFFAFY